MIEELGKANRRRKEVYRYLLLDRQDAFTFFTQLVTDPYPVNEGRGYLNLLGLKPSDLHFTPEITDILSKLGTPEVIPVGPKEFGERFVQGQLLHKWVLNESYPLCFGIDTHKSTKHVPVFKLPFSPWETAAPNVRCPTCCRPNIQSFWN
jgi:hypothetical protein